MFKNPSPELLEEEKQIQVTINNHIDNFNHINLMQEQERGNSCSKRKSLTLYC